MCRRRIDRACVICALFLLNACAGRYSGIRLYEMDLRLSLETERAQASVGEPIATTFVLTNEGPVTLDVCFEPLEQQIQFHRAGRILPTPSAFVDHAGCRGRSAIRSGAEHRWTEEVMIPDAAQGADELLARVTVVDPISCEGTEGCLTLTLESETIRFRVTPSDGPSN